MLPQYAEIVCAAGLVYADLRNNLGILLARSGDLTSAAEQFEAALKANPSHQTARRNLTVIREKLPPH